VDIDGNLFKTNVVANLRDVKNAEFCQQECFNQLSSGCQYFVFEQATGQCDLYESISEIEYDDDEDELKVMGTVQGCLPCIKKEWDYVQTGSGVNLIGYNAVYGVTTPIKCAMVCQAAPGCAYWSHHYEDEKCYLKRSGVRLDLETDYDYSSGTPGCFTDSCLQKGKKVARSYFRSNNLIGGDALEMIEGIVSPNDCQALCQLVDSCTHWTLDVDDDGCYLVSSPIALEHSEDKISGPRDCNLK